MLATAARVSRRDTVPYSQAGAYHLAVVVPTYNEVENVDRIVAAIDASLAGVHYEIIFVDDWSPDRTAHRISELAAGRVNIRVLRRFKRRGLSSAVLEGMMATMAPVAAVIDGDGQHDETLLPRLFELVKTGAADIAIGSRYCDSGSTGNWGSRRLLLSRIATRLSYLALKSVVADPMSGFFAIRRETAIALLPRLSGRGFKILFDLLASSAVPLRVVELPFQFRQRAKGVSKLDTSVVLDHLVLIADRVFRSLIPPRLAMFAAVGTLGLGVHIIVLRSMLSTQRASFAFAQLAAVLVSVVFNFVFNNSLTFRDRRLRGHHFLFGLAGFYLICGLGALADFGTGVVLFADHHRWWVSGAAGASIGSMWNFGASTLVTWRRR